MIDRQQSKARGHDVNVTVSTDGHTGPYITVGADQVDEVLSVLQAHGISCVLDDDAVQGQSATLAVIDLGSGADVEEAQAVLDAVP